MRHFSVLVLAILLLTGGALFLFRKPPPVPVVPKPVQPLATVSLLAEPPIWQTLNAYQETITRDEFERLLSTVFTTGEAWGKLIEITGTDALIKTGDPAPGDIFRLRFATPDATQATPRLWRSAGELPNTTRKEPLANLRIAIDPGHIGGEWAKMEERWFVVGDGQPVCEGDMTLRVAKLLMPKLQALGANVTLVRDKNEPVTQLRPSSLLTLAKDSAIPGTPESPQKLAERLFYRTAEIHARAKLVNESIKPDIVLCLHFNAEAWGDPKAPTLIDRTHLHLLVNGAYNDDEVILADQRFALLHKLLQRTQQEEILVGADVANSFAEISGLPPYQYLPENTNVRPIPGQPYLWARNLLANRLYDCPVIYIEPYVMNSKVDYERIQAGDYAGLREIKGLMRPSIFQEYAEALTQGLKNHYLKFRKLSD